MKNSKIRLPLSNLPNAYIYLKGNCESVIYLPVS